jgi:hypothetical protein
MITHAAVIIVDKRRNKECVIPCHRHCDAFYILKILGFKRSDYDIVAQGFLDENENFLTRVEAKRHAQACGQIIETEFSELYSEDLW